MFSENRQQASTIKNKSKQYWNAKDYKKLFEFILFNPHLVGSSPSSANTFTALHRFISPLKTLKECEIKMTNLAIMKPYDKMVDYLRKKTKLSDEWILEKKKESGYFHISHFKKELMELKESETIEHRALRMFLSNFYHKEAEFRSTKYSYPKIFTNPSSDHSKNLVFNQSQHDSPSKVIELKIIDPTEGKIDFFKENNGDQQKNQIIGQQKETETLDLKTFKWNCLQKLSYLVFILKYQMQFGHISQHNLTKTIDAQLAIFMRPVTFRDCNQYHVYLIKKHKTVESIISSFLNEDFYIKENELMREIKRIQTFFENDVQKQLNAFASKSKLTLESSDEEVFEIARTLKQQLIASMNFTSFDQQRKNPVILKQPSSQMQQPKLQFEDQMQPIQLPVELTIVFEAENDVKNPSQFVVKVQNDQGQFHEQENKTQQKPRRQRSSNFERQDFRIVSKKERLKEKKIEKFEKSEIRRSSNQKEDVFVESEQDFDQFNPIAGNHSESKSDQSLSEKDKSKNQEDCENQELVNVIKKSPKQKSKFTEDNMLNQSLSKSNLQFKQEKQSVVQKETYHHKQQNNNFWTLSQRMKLIVFMTVNKMTFLQGNYFDKYGIRENLSKYVGTSRSKVQCKAQIGQLKQHHRHDMDDLLVKEGKKFGIDEGLLQEWKQITANYSSKNHVTIENYSLEVTVLPMKYVMGSQNEILSQLCDFLKKGPIFEIIMREAENEVKQENEDLGKILQKSTICKKIRFQLRIQTKEMKITKIKIESIWNWVVKSLDEIIKH